MFLIGILLFFYVVIEAFEGNLQYSFEGWIGSGLYSIGARFSSIPSKALFMNVVYGLTLLISFIMIYVGFTGHRRIEQRAKYGKE